MEILNSWINADGLYKNHRCVPNYISNVSVITKYCTTQYWVYHMDKVDLKKRLICIFIFGKTFHRLSLSIWDTLCINIYLYLPTKKYIDYIIIYIQSTYRVFLIIYYDLSLHCTDFFLERRNRSYYLHCLEEVDLQMRSR